MADGSVKPYSDPRWWKDAGGSACFCDHCKHDHGDFTCDAYPEHVPKEALVFIFKDNRPNEICANGIGFEQDPDRPIA